MTGMAFRAFPAQAEGKKTTGCLFDNRLPEGYG
jgi:hypothetical protein